jgi:hypothetical protein
MHFQDFTSAPESVDLVLVAREAAVYGNCGVFVPGWHERACLT